VNPVPPPYTIVTLEGAVTGCVDLPLSFRPFVAWRGRSYYSHVDLVTDTPAGEPIPADAPSMGVLIVNFEQDEPPDAGDELALRHSGGVVARFVIEAVAERRRAPAGRTAGEGPPRVLVPPADRSDA
jgi:hypothetical protein